MSLLLYPRYVQLTGDTTTAVSAVEAAILDAEKAAREFLRRPLEFGTYTERLPVHAYGRAYPRAVPVVSVPASASYQVEDSRTLRSVSTDALSGPLGLADWGEWEDAGGADGYRELYGLGTVTYTGGWTAADVPYKVERAIAFMAFGAASPGLSVTSMLPYGAGSVSLGDVSVGFPGGSGVPEEAVDELWAGASAALIGFRWRDGGL